MGGIKLSLLLIGKQPLQLVPPARTVENKPLSNLEQKKTPTRQFETHNQTTLRCQFCLKNIGRKGFILWRQSKRIVSRSRIHSRPVRQINHCIQQIELKTEEGYKLIKKRIGLTKLKQYIIKICGLTLA